ncbi:MAG: transcriptional regulator [bacterium]|nr:transcriptional regulator [bacterium]
MAMDRSESMKKEILSQYRSVRQFAMEMGIPYSTLVTALDRGIDGMAYSTVICMCDRLHINPVDFMPMDEDTNSSSRKMLQDKVMKQFLKLNKQGRERILEVMADMAQLDKYAGK